MRYIHSDAFSLHNTAVALGKFEGLHLGHQLLLKEIMHQKENNLHSVVFTFDTPPRMLFDGKLRQQIYSGRERYRILKNYGIDIMIEHPFTKDFAALEPEEFIRDVLVKKTGAKVIVVGKDFRFGKKRSGGILELLKYSDKYGYRLIALDKLQMDDEDVSSSRIKEHILNGNMEEARRLLGRPYYIESEVIHGKALGRTIQIPTANQVVEEKKLTPPNGVYVSRIVINDNSYYGITNIGVRPTVESGAQKGIETHIFDFSDDIYDERIRVELLHYCRPEKKFDNIDELVSQMQSDIKYAKEYLVKC